MVELVLTDADDALLRDLRQRAARQGRTPTEEAKVNLAEARCRNPSDAWAPVDWIYDRLAGSGRSFSDSADLLREDRDR